MVFVAMVHKRVMRLTPWGEIWCCGITNTMLNASMHYLCAKCAKIDCVIKLIVIFITCVTDFQLRSLATVKHASWGACPLPIPLMNNDYLHSDSDLDTQTWTLKKISFSAPLSILATLCLSLAHSSTKPPSIYLCYLSCYGSMSYLMGMTDNSTMKLSKFVFCCLLTMLGTDAGLWATQHVSLAEQVAIFLHSVPVPSKICSSTWFSPYVEECISNLDGTHIPKECHTAYWIGTIN